MLKALHNKTNQELYEKHLCNQSSHYEKYEYCVSPPSPIYYCLKS